MRPKFLFFLLVFAATNAFAQVHSDEFGIQTDNDAYLLNGSDRYYTNGIFFYYRHALPVKSPDSTALKNKILGFELGQKMYNPQLGRIPDPVYDDRPFAGYLYIGTTLNLLYRDESNLKLSVQLGVVGPASLAGQLQVYTHKLLGLYNIEGWQYQIKNDPELNLSLEYNRLLLRGGIADVSLASYANLGNGFTGAGAGPLFRAGKFNQLYNSESTQSTASANSRIKPLHDSELFLYYKPQINYVAYDATIEGGLLERHNNAANGSQEVVLTIEPVIFSQQIGAVYSTGRFIYDVSVITNTKNCKQMIQPDKWASILVIYRFH